MRRAALLPLVLALAAIAVPSAISQTPPAPPAGFTGIALDARVELAWTPVLGAASYSVYRGTTPTTVTTRVSPVGGVIGTTFADTSASNGTTYYYAVRSVSGGNESSNSHLVSSTPRSRACSAGNPVVLENCFPGSAGWDVTNPGSVAGGGIEGFATAQSVNRGQSVDLKVKSGDGSTFRIEIYRSGYYGGAGARLYSVIHGVPGVLQPACIKDATTGLNDCSNWSVSATITTTASWPSGVYLLRLVREDTGSDNHVLLTVRDDSSTSDILWGTGDTTYQAYNNYGGKSLYDSSSTGADTVAGTPRAVKVSFDRPYEQPRSGRRDWYTRIDYPHVYWLEREGFDVAYQSNTDLERNPARARNHGAYFSPAHDEYWSAAMRTALRDARDAGTNLFFAGSNELYWKVRFEDSPVAGGLDRVMVCYKSTQSGGPDPSGIPTGTWRDPAGANDPENALTGVLYVGDADNTFFPLVVSATEGADRVYRYTGLETQPPGSATAIGSSLVGWEWDSRMSTYSSSEPAGVKTLASSPVTGNLIQNHGANSIPGSATAHVVKYTAPSGALVFTTGTNHWARGLALNAFGAGEPEVIIQQVTTNVLADMGAVPATPSADIVLDDPSTDRPPAPSGVAAEATGSDGVTVSWNPVAGADGYHVYRALSPREGGQPLGARGNPSLVTGTSFTDVGLVSATTYYYVVTTVRAGSQSLASEEVAETTAPAAGESIRLNVQGPEYVTVAGQLFREDAFFTGGNAKSVTSPIAGTNDPELYQDERWGDFGYAIPVTNGKYDVRFHFVELYYGTSEPGGPGKRVFGMDILDTAASPDIQNLDVYAEVGANHALVKTVAGVDVSDGVLNIQSVYGPADDPELAALEVVPQPSPPSVTSTVPAQGATDVSPSVLPRATFSRDVDPATVNASSFTLRNPSGQLVSASVSYDAPTRTATLRPSQSLALSSTYEARLDTTVTSVDGIPLAAPVSWSFTTAAVAPPPPQVTARTPAPGATQVARNAVVEATFSRAMEPATITASSFTLTGPGGPVGAQVTYDPATRTARLTPSAQLEYETSYTARLDTTILASDDTPLAGDVTWTFTTLDSPPPPTVVSFSPADDSAYVARNALVTATFSRSMDPATLTIGTFVLEGADGLAVPAQVSYDDVSRTATLTPSAQLPGNSTFTAQLEGSIRATDGAALGTAQSWTFATAACPCNLFSPVLVPAKQNNPVQDSRTGPGPWSRELGVKLKVDEAMRLTALRFYKSSSETGTHIAKVWTPGGAELTRATFANETASGWQQQALASPLSLQPGSTYVVSINANAYYPITQFGLQSLVVSGPLRSVVDGLNGVYGAAAGDFPTSSYRSSNYFVDVEVVPDGDPPPPSVVSTLPATGAAGVLRDSSVRVAFSRPMEPSSFTAATFSLRPQSGGAAVAAALSYDDATNSAVLTPASPLAYSTAYTAQVTTGVRARDGVRLSSPVQWSFTVADPVPPQVVFTLPGNGATDVGPTVRPRAELSKALKPETVNGTTVTLTGPGGPVAASVAYDAARQAAVVTPSAELTVGATYTVRLDASIEATDDATLATPYSWSFAVNALAPLQVADRDPAAGATGVLRRPSVQATFNRSVDPATVTNDTFRLRAADGSLLPAAVSYDPAARTATLVPNALLASLSTYTAEVTTGVLAADGTPLAADTAWSFTTRLCPCSLFSPTLAPAMVKISTRDGRPLPGPWTRELGVKIVVDAPNELTAIRFYKDTKETGAHTGSVWTSSGVKLGSVAFASETASGWQQQALATPVQLQPGVVYVVSVNVNAYYVTTQFGLQTQVVSGPLRSVADGANGVFSDAAGVFPTRNYRSSNYFVDVVVQ